LTRVPHALYGNIDPMILPGSSLFTLILLILGLLCWGSWANTLKMAAPKWRFELFYYDFAIGAFAATVIAAFTFGSLGLDGFTVLDDLSLAGKRQDAFALAAGAIFNLGNLLLVAAISLSGLSVALPVGLGVALMVGSIAGRFTNPSGSALMLWVGCASVLAAVVFDIVAWQKHRAIKAAEAQATAAALAAEQTAEGKTAPKGKKPSRKRQSVRKSVFLAVLAGILLGSFYPLLGMAQEGENGIGPYTAAFLFGLAVAFSTFAYNLFFMNLPVQGKPVEVSEFFAGAPKQHLTGILGGAIWAVGTVAVLVAGKTEATASVAPALASALGYSVPLVGAAWGLVVWKEYSGAENSIKMLLAAMFVLFAVGIAMVSLAPGFGVH